MGSKLQESMTNERVEVVIVKEVERIEKVCHDKKTIQNLFHQK